MEGPERGGGCCAGSDEEGVVRQVLGGLAADWGDGYGSL